MRLSLTAICLFLISTTSHAYMSHMTTGDILQKNQVQALGYLEFWRGGANINARASVGLNDSLQGDLEVSAGDIDFMVSAMAKWVPIPDYQKQPALGIRGGITYLDTGRYTQTSFSATPFASKAIESPHGKFSPYFGIPIALNTNSDDTFLTTRAIVGMEWTHPEHRNIHIIGEGGIKISTRSFGSVNIGVSYDF